MVTNSVKYAHPSGVPVAITIRGTRIGDDRLVFDDEDDGVGLPEGFDPAVDGSIGFLIVRNRAEQLGANYCFDHDPLGIRFHLIMPAEADEVSGAR